MPRRRTRRLRLAPIWESAGMEVRIDIPPALGEAALDAALAGLQGLAEAELSMVRLPPLYQSGVRYQREPRGSEHWLLPSQVLGRGAGDCEDLAAWRAAELRTSGEDPFAQALALRSGPRTWHAAVIRGDGTIEDPSAVLGMRAPAGLVAPVRFALRPELGRDWRAHVLAEGAGWHRAYDETSGCPTCALAGALDAAMGDVGQIPFVGPILDLISQAAQAATGRAHKPAQPPAGALPPGAMMPGAQARPQTLEEGVLDLALQLRRLAKQEVRRLARAGTRALAP